MWSSLRLALLLLGAIALWWFMTVAPIFKSVAPASAVSERILANESFKLSALRETLALIEREPAFVIVEPAIARAQALVRLTLADTISRSRVSEDTDGEAARTISNLRYSLSLNPADSALWLMLYSVQTSYAGLNPSDARLLEASYVTGPLEGAVALRRSPVALAGFEAISSSTQELALREFVELVDAEFTEQAAQALVHAGPKLRAQLAEQLKFAALSARKRLAQRLVAEGVKIPIPGIVLDQRHWK